MEDRPDNLSAADARQRLEQGNDRYRQEHAAHPHADGARRSEVAAGQHPFAPVLTCADSRVPPELIFDHGLRDLFVIRVAGNICDDAVLGSLEYAVLHLGVNLVVVMGHGSCGAVDAAVHEMDFDGPEIHSHIDALIAAIRPAVVRARRQEPGDLLAASVRENALMVADQVREAQPIMVPLASQGVEVKAACYDLDSGEVTWL